MRLLKKQLHFNIMQVADSTQETMARRIQHACNHILWFVAAEISRGAMHFALIVGCVLSWGRKCLPLTVSHSTDILQCFRAHCGVVATRLSSRQELYSFSSVEFRGFAVSGGGQDESSVASRWGGEKGDEASAPDDTLHYPTQ